MAQDMVKIIRLDSYNERVIDMPNSAEGHEFFISRDCAMMSGTMKTMLSSQFKESKGEINFPDISAPILEKVAQYLYYKLRHTNSNSRIPEFAIEPELALELLMAANYLDC